MYMDYRGGSQIQNQYQQQTYFDNSKKGEINELKQLLAQTLNTNDIKKRQEVVKKVIALMTQGIDMSKLFSDMCMASYTQDMIQKKMIYLYLSTYAERNPDLAIMAINTFLKDCQNTDPKVRGLALRNLCGLRFQGVTEYMMPALYEALKDFDAYVRKTAIMGCIKAFSINKIKDTLYQLVRDVDCQVIICAINALNEILYDDGGIVINQKMIVYLLNRFKEFNEWGQQTLLNLLLKYVPKNEDEMFGIMNILDERLKSSSAGVILDTIKIMINYASLTKQENLIKDVINRIQGPLITTLASCEVNTQSELSYVILGHIKFILSRGETLEFQKEYKRFYCKFDEPTYIQFLKLDILALIANMQNLGDILNELSVYVQDVNSLQARKSIEALGQIALRNEDSVQSIIQSFILFLQMDSDQITNQVFITMQQILQYYPQEKTNKQEIFDKISEQLETVEPQATLAILWILGQYGEHIENSPYIIENYLETFDQLNLENKNQILISSVKLFFKRPPEMQKQLGKLFQLILENDKENLDLKDRASFYYHSLQQNPQLLMQIIQQFLKVNQFLEESEQMIDSKQIEFNTLSVCYEKSAKKFIKPDSYYENLRNNQQNEQQMQKEEEQQQEMEQEKSEIIQQPTPEKKEVEIVDLLNNDVNQRQVEQTTQHVDFLDLVQEIDVENLQQSYEMDGEQFQELWEQYQDGATKSKLLKNHLNLDENNVESFFAQQRLGCVASGEMDNELKFYFYAMHIQSQNAILVELQINKNDGLCVINVKCQDDQISAFFVKYIEQCMSQAGWL